MTSSNTIIVGTGIIGLSTAFYLSENAPRSTASTIHLVDTSPTLFKCASGLAAGFLGADWFSPPVAPLGELSFKLHKELKDRYNGEENWGYSESTSASLSQGDPSLVKSGFDWLMHGTSRASAASGSFDSGDGDSPAWLKRYEGDALEVLSRGRTTAQVDPKRLCEFLLGKCKERGVVVHFPARVVGISYDARDELAGARILSVDDGVETDIPCTRLLLTSGPWTPQVFSTLFPSSPLSIPITSLAGHSLILKSPRYPSSPSPNTPTHAIFTTAPSASFSPEFFSRGNGEIWFGGLNSSSLPLSTETVDRASIDTLMVTAKRLLGEDVEVLREAVCFRPVMRGGGGPVLMRVGDELLGGGVKTRREAGVFVAAGHGPWGISLSLGTGKVMAELMEGVAPSVDISGLALS